MVGKFAFVLCNGAEFARVVEKREITGRSGAETCTRVAGRGGTVAGGRHVCRQPTGVIRSLASFCSNHFHIQYSSNVYRRYADTGTPVPGTLTNVAQSFE